MKTYVPILIGIVVLAVALYGGNAFMKRGGRLAGVSDAKGQVAMKPFVGQVVRVFEGDNVLEYSFDIPETATTSTDMDGALIHVVDTDGSMVSLYMSYEGARGYAPLDYISNTIASKVAVIDPMGTTTLGSYDWQVAESPASEWRVASVDSGKWLIVAENKKAVHDMADRVIESISVK
jgi:hypothetical protein